MDLSGFFNAIDKRAEQSIPIEDGDYFNEDGLLMCGKCHTPKQVRINFLGEIKTPMCLCKCKTEKRDAEEKAYRQSQRMLYIKHLRSEGFPDAEMQKWTFEQDDQKNQISKVARNYVENFDEMLKEGKGLLLFGTVGTGKSFISACIANALIDKGHACMMTNFARLTNQIQGKFEGRQEFLDGLNRYDLLVIDDLASERDTEYMGEVVQNIIDSRYRAKKPLIVTTNLTSEELKNPAEIRKQRIYSRLFEMCIPVEVKGSDRRKQHLRDDIKKYNEMLGL